MKCLVIVLLLGLIGSNTISARSRPWNEDDDNTEVKKIIQCQNKLIPCYAPLGYLQAGRTLADIIEIVRQTGAQKICSDLFKGQQCFTAALAEENCTSAFRPDAIANMNKLSNLLNYVCVNKINEISQHWNCLLNDKLAASIERFQREISSDVEQCRGSGVIIDAFERSTFGNDACTSEDAIELVEDIATKTVKILPHCNA